jgi:hypothetical protein
VAFKKKVEKMKERFTMTVSRRRIRWPVSACIALGLLAGLLIFCCSSAMADEGGTEPLASGENQPQPCLYFIIDDTASWGAGHAAIIICDGTNYYYYSYGPTPKYGPTGLITNTFSDWASAKTYAKSGDDPPANNTYTREEHWYVTKQEAVRAKAKAESYANTPYHATTHNCWNMVFDAISRAVPLKIMDYGPLPKVNFERNKGLADGHSDL